MVNTNFNDLGTLGMPLGLGSKNTGSMSSTKLSHKYLPIESKISLIQPNSRQQDNFKFHPTAKIKKTSGNNQSV